MNRIIIMLAGALLATTAHAKISTTDLDVAVTKLTNEVRKVPTGRRIAMYNQSATDLTLAGTGTAIEGISHTKTGVTVPAGTYAVTVEYTDVYGYNRAALYAGTGTLDSPVSSEYLAALSLTQPAQRFWRLRGVLTFAASTRIYLSNDPSTPMPYLGGLLGAQLTIEQLDD